MRVLDVGCGWGSFAIHAARELRRRRSPASRCRRRRPQLARERVAQAGLSDRVEIRVRRLPPAAASLVRRDREHRHGRARGRAPDRPVRALAVQPAARRAACCSTTRSPRSTPSDKPLEDVFSMRYVFPDGEPLPLSRVQLALERAGFHTEHVEGFREDYADHAAPLERAPRRAPRRAPSELAGAERTRVWRLYLRAARHGFDIVSRRPSTRCARESPPER